MIETQRTRDSSSNIPIGISFIELSLSFITLGEPEFHYASDPLTYPRDERNLFLAPDSRYSLGKRRVKMNLKYTVRQS